MSDEVVKAPEGLAALLINDHLDACGRLQLFQTCKHLSNAVLQQGGAHLTLSSASNQTAAQQAVAQTIAAGATTLSVKLQGRLCPMPTCTRACVTSLELRKVTLPHGWAQALYKMPNLRILSLRSCQFPASPDGVSTPRPLPALRKCTIADCKPLEKAHEHLGPVLADSETLTQLVGDDRAVVALLPHLPALTALQCTPKNTMLGDHEFEDMIAHPTLEHVVLGKVYLRRDYSQAVCGWKTLLLTEGVPDVTLTQLPLRGLELTVAGNITMYPEDKLDAFAPGCGADLMRANPNASCNSLRSCKQVTLKGSRRNGFHSPFTPREPCFHVFEVNLQQDVPGVMLPQLPGLLQVAVEHTVGTLAIHICTLVPELLSCVSALNPAVHTLCIIDCPAPVEFWAGLLGALPGSIRHLAIAGNHRMDVDKLVVMLSSSKAHESLKLLTLSEDGVEKRVAYAHCVPYDKLSAAVRRRVEAAAAEHQPHCRVQWQAEYLLPTPY